MAWEEYKNLQITVDDGVATLTLNRPQVLNALNSETLTELEAALEEVKNDSGIRVLIITGGGKAFAAGADIAEMRDFEAEEGRQFGLLGGRVFRKVETMPIPVIAAVNGFALGGGCELAMACDFRIASKSARFGQPEVGLGITPGFSGTQRLPRLVGAGMAKELIFRANIIDAEEAYRIGLVNHLTDPEELMDYTMKIAREIAAKAPLAVRYSKEAINEGLDVDMESAIKVEAAKFGFCFATRDQKTGMTAFLEKKKAQFEGR